MPASISLPVLAAWEGAIGIGLLSGRYLKLTLPLFAQMAGTFLPLAFFPHETFKRFPFVPTLEGQYIIKNLVLVSASLVIGATTRGGRLIHDACATQMEGKTRKIHANFRRRFHSGL